MLDFKTGQPITRHFVKEISINQKVVLRVEQAAKKNGFRPHAEPIFRTYALPTGVQDNDNNKIEDDSLSDEEGSVSPRCFVLWRRSDRDEDFESDKEKLIPGVDDTQNIGSQHATPDEDAIPGPLIDPDTCGPHFRKENGAPGLYLEMLRALYGMMVSSLLFYMKLGAVGFQC